MIFTIILPVIIFSCIAVALHIVLVKKSIEESIHKEMKRSVIDYANQFNAYLMQSSQVAKTTANMLNNIPNITTEQMYNHLYDNAIQSKLIYGGGICFEPYSFLNNKKLFCPYVFKNKSLNLKSIDISLKYDYTQPKWEYWSLVKQTNKEIWTEPYFDEGAGDIMMTTFSTPFFKNGEFRGVTTVDIPLNPLWELLDISIPEYINFTIISKKGTIVYSRFFNEYIGTSILELAKKKNKEDIHQLALKAISGDSGLKEMRSLLTNQKSLFSYAPIKSAHWSMVIQVDKSIAMKSLYEEIYRIIFASIIVISLLVTVILKASNRITIPIDKLTKHANNISIDNLEKKIELDPKKVDSELHMIGTVLNNMQNNLLNEIEKNKKHEDTIVFQSELAQTGEMINLIAHQWRQPLSVINMAANGLKVKREYGLEINNDIEKTIDLVLEQTQKLSQTIEDFRDFYEGEKKAVEKVLCETVKKACNTIKPLFTKNNINIIDRYHSDKKIVIIEEDIIHVIITILKSILDNIIINKTNCSKILLEVYDESENINIVISNNCDIFKNETLDKIFDLNFSIEKKQNSNINLHTSKIIIENIHNGNINIENTQTHTTFKINLPVNSNIK